MVSLAGAGARGMGPLRALLEWTPVQAHATAHKVTLIYASASPASAAFLADWDTWREAGVRKTAHPCILLPPATLQASITHTESRLALCR